MSAHNTRSFLYQGNGRKAIPLNALPEEAWTPLNGDLPNTQAQSYAAAVAYLYRAIDVRANALCAVPWKIAPSTPNAEPIWTSEDEDIPDSLSWAQDLPMLLWRSVVSWCFYNEAFWLKERNRLLLLNLKWLDPDSMTPVWDKDAGLVRFDRRIGTDVKPLKVADTVYLWRQGLRETTPATPPAAAAMQAAGVLYNADKFAADFFERGAIKATLLSIDGNPSDADLKKLEAWWKRFFSGVKSAWTTAAVRADVKAVPVGEGLESLTNSTLTAEKREDIATAMGVPHSLIMANAANYATAAQDERNFYNLTIVPDCLLIQRQLNRQLFAPMGMRFSFDPQEMAVYQEDETKRSAAFAAYVTARDSQGRSISIGMAAEMLGLYLPNGMEYKDLDELPPEEQEAPEPEEPEPVTEVTTGRDESARDEEVKRLQRWLKKRPNRDPSEFVSTVLSEAERVAIAAQLKPATKEAQPVETGVPFRIDDWDSYP